ncbi:MAG: lipid-A-disaccharide synthase N-terminal domain-containing protein [Phycisphaeraceae bacterium]|nr:lipid-A-disaccharide synthase N-terminal domain-containing protein [Phycisphaeraceae bacterium]HRJ50195.1 lipid-A-disaccharide synthase N-terminal domain-containing protein [Phycisphaerales bacterium]
MKIQGRRIKWEPGALFLLVLLVGIWLAIGPDTFRDIPTRPGATTFPIRVADSRGVVETTSDPASGQHRFRMIMRDGHLSPDLSEEEFGRVFGPRVLGQAMSDRPNMLFRKLNITSWAGLAWLAIGFGGQFAFSARMLIQWWASERRRQSHVPTAFWLWSLIGSAMLFSYFVWRQDPVGVLGQCTGLVVYARNLRLIYKTRRRERRADGSASLEGIETDRDGVADDRPAR